MKAPPITPGHWAAQYDNPCCVIPGHTIKTAGGAHTPIGIVCKGTGASPEGVREQKANARAVAALPEVLKALERALPDWSEEDYEATKTFSDGLAACEISYGDVRAIKAALIKAGYTFDS